jgi:hypothetical protein
MNLDLTIQLKMNFTAVAAYYNDVTDQQTYVTYNRRLINYSNTSANNYSGTVI